MIKDTDRSDYFDENDYDYNAGSKTGIMLIHGFSSTTYEFKELAKFLSKANAKITAASMNQEIIKKLKNSIKITEVYPEELFNTKCDIISPCALGGAINESTKKQLKCKAIVGAANNQLDKPETSIWLKENNIFYAPDYLVNSGGVIAISCEINNSEDTLNDQLNKISIKVLSLLKENQKSNLSTDKIAQDLAWKRINS